MDNNEIFLDFWANYQWPEPKPVIFRLYYDELTGRPLSYSMDELDGKYVDISPDEYALSDYHVRVRDNKIIPAAKPLPPKLVPSTQGISCHPAAVDIVVDILQPNQPWMLKYDNESN